MIWHYIEIIAAQQHQSWYKPNNFSCCFKHIKAHINMTISHLVKQEVRNWYLELFKRSRNRKHSEDSTIINQIRLIYTFWTINIYNLESWWVQNTYNSPFLAAAFDPLIFTNCIPSCTRVFKRTNDKDLPPALNNGADLHLHLSRGLRSNIRTQRESGWNVKCLHENTDENGKWARHKRKGNAITTQRNRKNELRQPQQNTMEALWANLHLTQEETNRT